MINVNDLKGALPVARRGLLQFPIKWLLLVSRSAPLPFEGLFVARAPLYRLTKGLITGCHDSFLFTSARESGIDLKHFLLLDGFVIILDEFIEQSPGGRRQFVFPVSGVRLWQ